MKHKNKTIFLTLALAMISFYGNSCHADEEMDHSKMNHGDKVKMSKSGRKNIDLQTKKEMNNVLQTNELLHSAFFDYDAKKVESNAKLLSSSIESVSNPEIKNLLKFSLTKLAEIKADSKREDNDQNYHLVSMALIHVVSKYDVGNEYNAYSCPMVKKKWLQNSKKMAKVHNPYAPNMPHCGGQDTSH